LGGADPRFLSPQPDTSLHCQVLYVNGASASRGVPVYFPAFTDWYTLFSPTHLRRPGWFDLGD